MQRAGTWRSLSNNDKRAQIRVLHIRWKSPRKSSQTDRGLITCSIKVLKVNFRCRLPLNLLPDISSFRRPAELVLIYLSFKDLQIYITLHFLNLKTGSTRPILSHINLHRYIKHNFPFGFVADLFRMAAKYFDVDNF